MTYKTVADEIDDYALSANGKKLVLRRKENAPLGTIEVDEVRRMLVACNN